jgi:hypothetical protein
MAQEIDINLNVNAEQADKSLGSLKSQLREAQQEVQTLADKFGATSKEAVEAAKKAADLKDRIGDAKSLTEAFNPDAKFKALSASLTGVAGGFSAVTGAMGAFGGKSKAVEESLLKVQSAMAMASGLQAIGESIDSFKQLGAVIKSYTIVQNVSAAAQKIWNAAMAANPIGVIVVSVTALIAAGYALVNMFKSSSDASKKAEAANKALNKELDNQVKSQKAAAQEAELARDLQLGMAKASGKSAAEVRKLAVELANQEVTQKLANAQTLRAIAIEAQRVAGLEDATDAQKETAKRARKEFDDANTALKTSVLNRRKLLNENKIAETQEATDAREEAAEATKKANAEAKSKRDEATKKQLDDIKKANADKLAEEKRLYDERRRLFEDQIKKALDLEKELNQSIETPAEKENREYLEKKAILENNYRSTEILDKQHKEKLQQISNDAFALDAEAAMERDAKKKEEEDKKAAEDVDREQKRTAAIQSFKENLNNIISGIEASGLAKSKAGQALSKTLALTQIGIDTAVAIGNASKLATAEGAKAAAVGGPGAGTIARIVSYASSYAQVLANFAKAKTMLSSGGTGGGGGAAGGGGAEAAAPSFNVVGPSGANQIAESMGARESQPMRAFVVGGDVTTQQGLNRGIVQNATLG